METYKTKYTLLVKFIAVIDMIVSIIIIFWIGWAIFLDGKIIETQNEEKKSQADKIPKILIPIISITIGISGVYAAIQLLNGTDNEVSENGEIGGVIKSSKLWTRIAIMICFAATAVSLLILTSRVDLIVIVGSVCVTVFKLCGIVIMRYYRIELEKISLTSTENALI